MKRKWRMTVFVQLLILGAVFWPSAARAGWGTGCGPVGPTIRSVPSESWIFYRGCWYFYRNGVQVAAYDPETKIYRTYDACANCWSQPQKAPWQTAEKPAESAQPCETCQGDCRCKECVCEQNKTVPPSVEQNFGVDWSKIHSDNRYTLGGRVTGANEVKKALAGDSGGAVPDDSDKLRLTVIGSEAERQQVLRDVAKASWKDKVLVQDYAPTDWAVRPGFVTAGHPTIYLQAPDGKVLYHRDDYQQGPDGLAEAVRKADPKYDPSKDPNGAAPWANVNWADLEPYAPLAVLAVLALVVVIANRKRQKWLSPRF